MVAMLNLLHELFHFLSVGVKGIKVLIWNSITIAFMAKWALNSKQRAHKNLQQNSFISWGLLNSTPF